MLEEIKQEKYTPAFDDLSDITHQLHNAFSKIFVNESEEPDPHFSQLIKTAGHLRVEDFLTAPPVTTITTDIAIIRSAIYSYRGFTVSEGVVKPRGRHEQNSIVLRELPTSMNSEEVIKLFTDIPTCPTPASARSDVHNTWYVAFVSEDEAKAALAFIKSTTFGGKQIKARLKTDRNHNSPHNRDISNLDMNMNNAGMIPQAFSPAGYPQDPSIFFPGYIPHSPQYLYGQPMAPMFAPQFPPNGLFLDMNMAYPFAPLMYHPYYDPYSPNHHMMGYGNGRSPNRGGRSNRNSGRGYNNYSSRSRDQSSPRYQRNSNGYNSNATGETTVPETSEQQNSLDNNQIHDQNVIADAAVLSQMNSIDINDEAFEKVEVLTTEDEKVTTEVETVSPPSELSCKDQLEHPVQVVSNNDEIVEDGTGEASNESNKEEEDKPLEGKETDERKDPQQRDRDRRNRDRRRKDRNDRNDSTRGKEREKAKPPKLNMEVDFPSLNEDKSKAKAAQPAASVAVAVEEKPTTQQTTVFNYANIVKKANTVSLEPVSVVPAPQPTKSGPVKESSPAPKNTPEATTNPVNFGVSLSQDVTKSSSPKIQETAKVDLPETYQNKTDAVAPLSFGAFGESRTNSNNAGTKETIVQSDAGKVEGANSRAVLTKDQSKETVTATKTGKKSFIDVVKQNK